MKETKRHTLLNLLALALPAVVFLCSACSGEEEILREGQAQTAVESVTATDGEGDGSSGAPAIARPGKPCTLTIAQRSTYTEPDGSVFTCEPKAVIHAETSADTLFADDLSALTKITAEEQTAEESGSNPKTSTIRQTIRIGGKPIDFRLSYEKYSHTNKAGETFTMPYLELQPARLGRSEAQSRTDGEIPAVTLRRLMLTRGPVVSDTAQYEITARFSIEAASQNSLTRAAQAYEVEVRYAAVVFSSKELPDPFAELSYTISGAEKPYTATAERPLALTIAQQSRYTDSYSNTYARELTASFSAKVGAQGEALTFEPGERIDLTKLQATSQLMEKTETTYRQRYTVGRQQIDFSAAFQKAFTEESVEMAYLKIDTVRFSKIQSAEQLSGGNGDERTYLVKALFDVDLEPQNAQSGKKETLQVSAAFQVKAIVRQPQIVKVVYRPGWQWFEPHYNVTLSYIFIVYRDVYYDNGKVETSTFNNYVPYAPSFVGCYAFLLFPREWLNEHNIEYQCYSVHQEWNGGTFDPYTSLGVKDLSLLDVRPMEFNANDEYYLSCGDCYEYRKSHFEKLYHKDQFTNYDESVICHASESAFEQNFPKTNLPTGWYLCEWASKPLAVATLFYEDYSILQLGTRANISHLALVMDGRVIMFDEWVPKFKEAITSTPYTGSFSKGTNVRIEKRSTELQFLGRTFYAERADTIYQLR